MIRRGVVGTMFVVAVLSVLLAGVAWAKTITGTSGNDVLVGTSRGDTIRGLQGTDRIDGGAGPDVLQGNENDDRLVGGPSDDVLGGGRGEDALCSARYCGAWPRLTHSHPPHLRRPLRALQLRPGRRGSAWQLARDPIHRTS